MSILTNEVVAQVTHEIWCALLGADGPSRISPEDALGKEVVATVQIKGAWGGTVCLSCTRQAAREATSVMSGVPEAQLSPADIADALGELLSVVGGNVKSLVPAPSELALPQVGEEGTGQWPGRLELAHEVRFAWSAQPMVVSVWAKPPPG